MNKDQESPAAAQESKADTATAPQMSEVEAFALFYLRDASGIPAPPFKDGVVRVGNFTGITLFRQGPMQVQMWTCDPNSRIPEHAHPGVDVIQVYLWGQVHLTHNGKLVIKPEMMVESQAGLSSAYGAAIHVRPGDTHGAQIGPMGGAFLTIQHWLDGKPRSVETAWEGEYLSIDHEQRVRYGSTTPA